MGPVGRGGLLITTMIYVPGRVGKYQAVYRGRERKDDGNVLAFSGGLVI